MNTGFVEDQIMRTCEQFCKRWKNTKDQTHRRGAVFITKDILIKFYPCIGCRSEYLAATAGEWGEGRGMNKPWICSASFLPAVASAPAPLLSSPSLFSHFSFLFILILGVTACASYHLSLLLCFFCHQQRATLTGHWTVCTVCSAVQCSAQCAACSLMCTDVQSEAVSKLCSVQPTVSNFDCLLSEALCSQHCQCLMVHCAVNTLCAIVLVWTFKLSSALAATLLLLLPSWSSTKFYLSTTTLLIVVCTQCMIILAVF